MHASGILLLMLKPQITLKSLINKAGVSDILKLYLEEPVSIGFKLLSLTRKRVKKGLPEITTLREKGLNCDRHNGRHFKPTKMAIWKQVVFFGI